MNLPDLKQLGQFLALCRKHGVTYVKLDSLELDLSIDPGSSSVSSSKTRSRRQKDPSLTPDPTSEDTLTEEQLLMWSAGDPLNTETPEQ